MVFELRGIEFVGADAICRHWKQYSKNAIPQLARITFQRPSLRYFVPYTRKVMKMFMIVSKTMVA